MIQKATSLTYSKTLLVFTVVLFTTIHCSGQFFLQKENGNRMISIHAQTEFVDVGDKNVTLNQIRNSKEYQFLQLKNENADFGFTTHNFWFRFQLKNATNQVVNYYFETARPITDVAELFVIKNDKSVTKYNSGDAIPFDQRSLKLRKTIFKTTSKNFHCHR